VTAPDAAAGRAAAEVSALPAAAGPAPASDFTALRAALAEVVAIPVTPFTAGGAIDRTAHGALVRRLLDGGVRTLTPNGNTGEFYALRRDERRAVTELTAEAAEGRAALVVGIGHEVPAAVEAARQARDAGAAMVMVHQPVHPYVSPAGWVGYHRAIAEAVPELGVVPYIRTPMLRGESLAELGEHCPNVIGVKYAVPDAAHFAGFMRDAGADRFVWVAGLAEPYAPSYFSAGATGFTSGLVNVSPGISLAMLEALRQGDYPAAMKVWGQIRAFEELRSAEGSAFNVTVVKEALAQLGLCRRDVRPPSSPLTGAARAKVADIMQEWGV
jgi:4-hydroxy-tetrahydrodipicolinate synthase